MILSYIGGDEIIVDNIVALLPKGQIFIEAFGGSGAVSRRVAERGMYERVILNDKDYYVYSAYYILKYHPEIFDTICDFILYFKKLCENGEKQGIKLLLKQVAREISQGLIKDVVEAGFWAVVLSLVAVNWRHGNPMLKSLNRRYVGDRCKPYLMERYKVLQHIDIMNMDGLELVRKYDRKGVVIYIDPPHIGYNYYRLNFTPQQAITLAETLANIKHAKVLLKLSSNDLKYYEPLLKNWRKTSLKYLVQITIRANTKKKITSFHFLYNYDYGLERFLGL